MTGMRSTPSGRGDGSLTYACPCRCAGCHKESEPRPLGQTPDGWVRGRSGLGDSDQGRYWCPECAKLAGFTRV